MHPSVKSIELSRERTVSDTNRKQESLGFLPLFHRLAQWIRVKRLELQLWDNRRFQRRCEEIRCFHLAELEKNEIRRIEQEILRLKNGFEFVTPPRSE